MLAQLYGAHGEKKDRLISVVRRQKLDISKYPITNYRERKFNRTSIIDKS